MELSAETVLRRNEEILFARVGNERAVMLNLSLGKYYALNAAATRIWELLAERKTIGEISERIVQEFDVDFGTCQAAVVNFAEAMLSKEIAAKD